MLPTTSATHRSAFAPPGSSARSVESPPSTVTTFDSPSFRTYSRAAIAAPGSASTAKTRPAPQFAAATANSANGPVPMSSTVAAAAPPGTSARRAMIARSKKGVRDWSSRIAR